MTQKPDAHVAQAWYDALAGKDVPAGAAVLDDGSLLHVPGRSGLAGQYQGKEAILGLFRWMAELTDGTMRFNPTRVLTSDEQAIVLLGRINAVRRGKRLDTNEVHVLSLIDGKVREIRTFHQNQDHVDDFWTG